MPIIASTSEFFLEQEKCTHPCVGMSSPPPSPPTLFKPVPPELVALGAIESVFVEANERLGATERVVIGDDGSIEGVVVPRIMLFVEVAENLKENGLKLPVSDVIE